jgi:hypothetical protein
LDNHAALCTKKREAVVEKIMLKQRDEDHVPVWSDRKVIRNDVRLQIVNQ